MFKVYKKEIEVAGKKISLETGKIARQADGAIIAQCGETVVMATVVGAKKVNPDDETVSPVWNTPLVIVISSNFGVTNVVTSTLSK